MKTRRPFLSLAAAFAAALSFTLAGCGGGNAEAPPDDTTTVVTPVVPVVTITNNVAAEVATGDITFTFSFNVDVGTSFTADDVAVTGGTAGAFTRVDGRSATLVVAPTANSTGTVVVSVAADAVNDATGAGNEAVSAQKAFDTTAVTPPPPVGGGTLIVSFDEDPAVGLGAFGDASPSIATAPAGGTGAALKLDRSGASNFGGTFFTLPQALPFTADRKVVTARVYATRANAKIFLKVEAAGGVFTEVMATTGDANTWQTLTWDMSGVDSANSYTVMVISADTDVAIGGAQTYWIDEVKLADATTTGGGTTVVSFDEDPPVNLGAFGDAAPSIAAAPTGGTGAALKLDRSGGSNFGGTFFTLPQAVPFAADRKVLTARVYATRANAKVFLKVEAAGGVFTEVMATTGDANTWQTLTWDMSGVNPANSYTVMVFSADTDVAIGGAQTYWIDEVKLADATTGGTDPATSVVTFDEDPPLSLGAFGDAGPSIATAPTGGTGAALKLDRSGGSNFGGTFFTLPQAVPFAADRKVLTARVYATRANAKVFLKVEAAGGVFTEVMATTGDANTWQTLTWDMSGVNPANSYTVMVFSADTDIAIGGAQTYWIDEVQLEGGSGGGGGGGGAFTGIFAADYVGDLFVNATTAQGGDIGVFFDPRLPTSAAYDYAGVAGNAQNPGGVPNFYQGFGLVGAPITDAYYGAFVKAPGNGTVDVSTFTNLKLRVWGPDQLFQAGTFPQLRVVLQTPAVAGCASNSGGSELTASFQTLTQGAASEYTLPLSGFTVQVACSGESAAQILANLAQINILLEGTNIQYVNNQPGDAFGNGLNVGPISFE